MMSRGMHPQGLYDECKAEFRAAIELDPKDKCVFIAFNVVAFPTVLSVSSLFLCSGSSVFVLLMHMVLIFIHVVRL